MNSPSETKLEIVERILKDLTDAAYSTLCESNGVSDNEWRVEDGKAIPEWPVKGFYTALRKLGEAHTQAEDYFNPVEAARHKKWADACATAWFIVDEFRNDPSHMAASSLQRNIADAINGSLVQTSEDRQGGRKPQTMTDVLDGLVAAGKLVKYEPDRQGS